MNDRLERKLTFRYKRQLVRRRKVRRVMAKRVSPDIPFSVFSMGYNTLTAHNGYESFHEFSGSSLNRKKYDKKNQDAEETEEQVRERVGRQMVIDGLRLDQKAKHGIEEGRLASDELLQQSVHVIAKRSRGKIRDKFTAFFKATVGTNTFCTLTFIQQVSDGQAIKILNKFLTSVRKDFGEVNYIWVAERQKENKEFPDNIHFHIIFDRILPVDRYNPLWIMQQYNAGLKGKSTGYLNEVGQFKSKGKIEREISFMEISMACAAGEGKKYFNPFDIKKVESTEMLTGYLTKYVTKNYDSFGCLAWHCSRKVSRLFTKRKVSAELFEQAGDADINFNIDDRTGEWRGPRTVQVYTGASEGEENRSGTLVCLVRYILNRKFFDDFLKVLDNVNRWILYGGFYPDMDGLKISIGEYAYGIMVKKGFH